jgi:hypothetical protein
MGTEEEFNICKDKNYEGSDPVWAYIGKSE